MSGEIKCIQPLLIATIGKARIMERHYQTVRIISDSDHLHQLKRREDSLQFTDSMKNSPINFMLEVNQVAMVRFVLTLLVVSTFSSVFAQQESQYTSFTYNELYYNPATAGSRGLSSVTGLIRQQWLGFEGAPSSQLISFNTPLFSDKVGFGLLINHASKGIIDNVYTAMAYNYKVKINETTNLRLGLQGSVQRWGVDFSGDNFRIQNPRDNSIDLSDTFVKWQGNFGFGALLQVNDRFNVGISAPNLYTSSISVDDNLGEAGARISPHFYVTTSAIFDLSSQLSLKPALLVKVVNDAPVNIEGNISLIYNQQIMAGIGYREGGDGRGESLNLLLFFQTSKNFGIGGAYDIGISELSAATGGSLEVFGRLDFGGDRDDLENPRFF